jgi:hypothetical protein
MAPSTVCFSIEIRNSRAIRKNVLNRLKWKFVSKLSGSPHGHKASLLSLTATAEEDGPGAVRRGVRTMCTPEPL